MPENPTHYLNQLTITVLDDLYTAIREAASARGTSVEALVIEYVCSGLGLEPTSRLSVPQLRELLIQEMKLYAVDPFNGQAFFTQSDDQTVFTVVDVGHMDKEHFATTGLIVRMVNDCIVIDSDLTDKPLVDALVQAGIPRSQIILAYAGEPIPETA